MQWLLLGVLVIIWAAFLIPIGRRRSVSGRGVSYWTDGKGDERILYVTTGYRLIALNAKTGAMIPAFGKDGVVDLKVGAVKGRGEPIELERGEIGSRDRRGRRSCRSGDGTAGQPRHAGLAR